MNYMCIYIYIYIYISFTLRLLPVVSSHALCVCSDAGFSLYICVSVYVGSKCERYIYIYIYAHIIHI